MARNSLAGNGEIKRASATFREALNDGGLRPSMLLLNRMRDARVEMAERVAIAEKLVQYELPRLAAIEADIQTTERTHEEWLAELAEERAERTMQ